MRRISKILGIGVLLVIALVGAGIAVLLSVDFNQYRPLIEARVQEATGRAFTIRGDLRLKLSLDPTIAVEDVIFANAAWGSRADMVRLDRIEAKVELLPLISGDIRVRYILLSGLDLLAETDAKGRGNWDIAIDDSPRHNPAPGTASDGFVLPVIHEVRVRDVRVRYHDGISGDGINFAIDTLDAGADGFEAPLQVAARGAIGAGAFSVSATMGSLNQLMRGEEPYPLRLLAKVLGATVRLDGAIAKPRELRELDLVLTVTGGDLNEALHQMQALLPAIDDHQLPAFGPYAISGRLIGSVKKLSLLELELAVGTVEQARLVVAGTINDVMAAAKFDLTVDVEGRNLTGYSPIIGKTLSRLKPVHAHGRLRDTLRGYSIDALTVDAGRSNLAGQINVHFDGVRPVLEGKLSSRLLDLDAFVDGEQSSLTAAVDGDGRMFSAAPLPFDGLRAVDAGLAFRGGNVRIGGTSLKNVALDLKLTGGLLRVSTLRADVIGGRVDGTVSIDATGARPRLALGMAARNLSIEQLIKSLNISGLLGGRVDADITLKGQGNSLRAIMAGLDGRSRLVGRGGRIDSAALGVASAGILDILPWVSNAAANRINCAISRFDIKAGVATSRALLLDTNGLGMGGEGSLDFGKETIDLSVVPSAKSISLAKLALPVRIGGTFMAPTYTPDVGKLASGAIVGAVKTAGGLLKMPVNILGSVFGSNEPIDADDPCRKALLPSAVSATQPPPPKPRAQSSQQETGVKGMIKGFGKSLEGILGGKK